MKIAQKSRFHRIDRTELSHPIADFGQGVTVSFPGARFVCASPSCGVVSNAVVSGVFIDPATNGSFSQRFVTDTVSGDVISAVGSLSSGTAVMRQYHHDALGSVEAVTRANATTEGDYKLDAFGNLLPSSAASATVPENPFVSHGGLGYWSEPELGLTYVRQRWLDTGMGQWLSVDPVEGEPRYSYAYNSPTRFVDADGTQVLKEKVLDLLAMGVDQSRLNVDLSRANRMKTIGIIRRANEVASADKNSEYPLFQLRGEWTPNDILRFFDDNELEALFKALLQPYANILRTSARQNCIPLWLLCTIITSELLDIGKIDVQQSWVAFRKIASEGSVGPAQIQIKSALDMDPSGMSHKPVQNLNQRRAATLVDLDEPKSFNTDEHSPFLLRMPAISKMSSIERERLLKKKRERHKMILFAGTVGVKLTTTTTAIEAAAREISLQLHRAINAPSSSLFARKFLKPYYDRDKLNRERCKNPNIIVAIPWIKDYVANSISPLPEAKVGFIIHALYNSPTVIRFTGRRILNDKMNVKPFYSTSGVSGDKQFLMDNSVYGMGKLQDATELDTDLSMNNAKSVGEWSAFVAAFYKRKRLFQL